MSDKEPRRTFIFNFVGSKRTPVVYTMFDAEMEIGLIKSVTTQDYKLIYLQYRGLIFVALADIKLDETQIQAMLDKIAKSFYAEYEEVCANWNNDLTAFYPFIPKMDAIVIATIADLFYQGYPENIVKLADYIDENYSLGNQELIGKALSGKILEDHFSGSAKKKNLKKELSKFTVVKRLEDTFIELSVCPFCRKKQSVTPICSFVTGFIKGMLKSDDWKEITCVSCGDASCSFSK